MRMTRAARLTASQPDQAQSLRNLSANDPVKVIAVASGKGGVGKTNVSINLALALAEAGKRVMILDADMGLANVDVLLGISPMYNLSHVLNGDCSLDDVIVTGPRGVQIIPAASGVRRMAGLGAQEVAGLVTGFNEIGHGVDVLIVDMPAGIAETVTTLSRACNEVLVVVCDEPASITDAYALIKVLNRDFGIRRFRVLANMAHSQREGAELFAKLSLVANRFLDVSLEYVGSIPNDEYVRKSVQKQKAVMEAYPGSRSSRAFKKLGESVDKWPVAEYPQGHLQFFFERLIAGRSDRTEAIA